MSSSTLPKMYRCYWVDEPMVSRVGEGYVDEPAAGSKAAPAPAPAAEEPKKPAAAADSKAAASASGTQEKRKPLSDVSRYRDALDNNYANALTDAELLEFKPEMPFKTKSFATPDMFSDYKGKAIKRVLQQTRPSLLIFNDDNGFALGANVLVPNPVEDGDALKDAFALTKRLVSAILTPIARARNQWNSIRGQFEMLRASKNLVIEQSAIDERVVNFTAHVIPNIRFAIETVLLSYLCHGKHRFGFSEKLLSYLEDIIGDYLTWSVTWSWSLPATAGERMRWVQSFFDTILTESAFRSFLNKLIDLNLNASEYGLLNNFEPIANNVNKHPQFSTLKSNADRMRYKVKVAIQSIINLPAEDLAADERRACAKNTETCSSRKIGTSAAASVETTKKKKKAKAKPKPAAPTGNNNNNNNVSFYYY